jgi:hypothetical protein
MAAAILLRRIPLWRRSRISCRSFSIQPAVSRIKPSCSGSMLALSVFAARSGIAVPEYSRQTVSMRVSAQDQRNEKNVPRKSMKSALIAWLPLRGGGDFHSFSSAARFSATFLGISPNYHSLFHLPPARVNSKHTFPSFPQGSSRKRRCVPTGTFNRNICTYSIPVGPLTAYLFCS